MSSSSSFLLALATALVGCKGMRQSSIRTFIERGGGIYTTDFIIR